MAGGEAFSSYCILWLHSWQRNLNPKHRNLNPECQGDLGRFTSGHKSDNF